MSPTVTALSTIAEILRDAQVAAGALPMMTAADARLGCSRLLRHLRALAVAGRLKPVALALDREDDRACAAVVGGLAGLAHYMRVEDGKLVFSATLTQAESAALLDFARDHKPPVITN